MKASVAAFSEDDPVEADKLYWEMVQKGVLIHPKAPHVANTAQSKVPAVSDPPPTLAGAVPQGDVKYQLIADELEGPLPQIVRAANQVVHHKGVVYQDLLAVLCAALQSVLHVSPHTQ